MRAVSLIGVGMALMGVWNGVPASYRGVPTSVVTVSYTHLVCIFFSVHGLERKPSVGFVS